MAVNEILGLTLDLSANTDKFVKDLQAAANSIDLDVDSGALIKSFEGASKQWKSSFVNTVQSAVEAGFSQSKLDKFTGKLDSAFNAINEQMKKTFDLEVKIKQAGNDQVEKDRLKGLLKREEITLRGMNKRFKAEQSHTSRIIKRRQAARADADALSARSMSEAGEDFGKSIESAFGKIKSGDVGGLLKSIGKGASARGAQAGAAAEKGGPMAGMLKGIGGMLSKIGPAIAAIGAIAAGFAAVAAIVIAADSAMKDLNRTLISSGVSAADLVDQYGSVESTFRNIQQSFAGAFSFNRLWGTTAKDHYEILGAYAQAGLTFKEITGGVADAAVQMEKLQRATALALTYSKLLGMSSQEVSTTMATYMEELGLTLEGVSARFSNIVTAAKESGFATKRFFNMVLQATSGMSMYNVRLEEAAGLLIHLGKILGEKMGGDFLANLMKGFKDEGTTDRIKKTLTTGVKLQSRVLQKDAVNAAKEFQRSLGELAGKDAGKGAAISDILKEYSLDPSDADAFAKKVGKLTSGQMGEISAKLKIAGPEGAGLARSLTDLNVKGQAFAGDRQGAQAARASAGGGAALFLQLNEVQAVLGKSLDQINLRNEKDRAAFENITGKSGEAAEQLRRVGAEFRGMYDVIRDAAKDEKSRAEFNEKYSKAFGVHLNEATGEMERIVQGPGGEVVFEKMGQGLSDLMIGLEDRFLGGAEGGVAEDILLAQEIAKNTTDMAKILEQGVEKLLYEINTAVQYMASFMGSSTFTEGERELKAKASTEMRAELKETTDQLRKQESEVADLVRRQKTEGEVESKVTQWAIDKKQAAVDVLQQRAEGQEIQLRAVRGMTKEKAAGFDIGGDFTMTSQIKAAAAAQPEAQAALIELLEKSDPDIKEKIAAAKQQASSDVDKEADKYMFITAGATRDERPKMLKRAQQQVVSKSLGQNLGLQSGVAAVDISKMAGLGLNDQDASLGRKKGLEELLGSSEYIGEANKAAIGDDTRDKKHLAETKKQSDDNAKAIVDGIKEAYEEKSVDELAAKLGQLTGETDQAKLKRQAAALRSGQAPSDLDLKKRVLDVDTGKERELGHILAGSQGGSAGLSSLVAGGGIESAPVAQDFLMQIGSGGRLKFAQRIDKSDTVTAMATKAGGAIRGAQASGGGTTIVNHMYHDAKGNFALLNKMMRPKGSA